jgi:hypothetical protein
MKRLVWGLGLMLTLLYHARAQVIEFESNGLKYQTLKVRRDRDVGGAAEPSA